MSGEGYCRQRKNEYECLKVGVCGFFELPRGKSVCWKQSGCRESGRRPGGRREGCGSWALSDICGLWGMGSVHMHVRVCVCMRDAHSKIYITQN